MIYKKSPCLCVSVVQAKNIKTPRLCVSAVKNIQRLTK